MIRKLTILAVLLTTPMALRSAVAEAADRPPLHETYREAAARLTGAALQSRRAYDTLSELCDNHGHRLSGSARLERAIDWAVERLEADGFDAVWREGVMVPHWVRGRESARVLEPAEHELSILGLGGSVGTPPGGLEAEVVVVSGFDELDALGEAGVRGKIVLYDVPFTTYGETVRHRTAGPSRAARLGAVAALVRSVGPLSLDTPHTGATRYADDAPRIPAAAVSIENATMMHRMTDRGDVVRVHLEMGARTLPDALSHNVVADVRGSELPDEVVVVAGHFDSWDVGQGAQDDGAGCIIAWEAARLIAELDLRPRRTVRVVLYTNEENGLAGGRAYAEEHADELGDHVALIESDSGNGPAAGFRYHAPPVEPAGDSDRAREAADAVRAARTARAVALLREISPLLEPVGAPRIREGGSGADVGPSVRRGAPGLGLDHDTTKYFEIHHTHADTFEKIVKIDLDRNVAAMAIMALVLADMPERLIDPAADPQPTVSTAAERSSFSRR